MSSQQQIDANRRNAQWSTGPQTPEGRDAVRFNALRHGLTAKTAVLAGENQEHFDEALEAFQAEYQPSGPTQNLLVQQMVMAAWRLARLRHIETGLFNLRLCDLAGELNRKYTRVPENGREAFVFRDDTINSRAIENLYRYETRIERSFYRALKELQRLQSVPPPDESSATAPDPEPNSADQTQSQPPNAPIVERTQTDNPESRCRLGFGGFSPCRAFPQAVQSLQPCPCPPERAWVLTK